MKTPESVFVLVKPNDQLTWTNNNLGFETPRVPIPDIGIAFTSNYKDIEGFTENDLGITVMDGHIHIDRSMVFARSGLHKLGLHFIDTPPPPFSLYARMYQKDGLVLTSILEYLDMGEEDRLEGVYRHNLLVDKWETPGNSMKLDYFVEPRVVHLSQLRFLFASLRGEQLISSE